MRRDLTVEELLLAQRRTVRDSATSATTADTTIAAGAPGKKFTHSEKFCNIWTNAMLMSFHITYYTHNELIYNNVVGREASGFASW